MRPALNYAAKRIAEGLVAVWGVVTLVFCLGRLSGDPVIQLLPVGASQDQIDALRTQLGLDQPFLKQYVDFLGQIAQGEFPDSLISGQPALELVLTRLPATAVLALVAMAIAIVAGGILGFLGAHYRGRLLGTVTTSVTVVGQAMPSFWFGLMLILLLSVHWSFLPVAGSGSLAHLVMPAITLAAYATVSIARMFRQSLIAVSTADYIRTARAKGKSELYIVLRHMLPNALLPVVTIIGLQTGQLLAGAVVTEVVFAWPGLGQLVVNSTKAHDFPVVQAAVLVIAVIFITINAMTDLLYHVIDPRVRVSGASS